MWKTRTGRRPGRPHHRPWLLSQSCSQEAPGWGWGGSKPGPGSLTSSRKLPESLQPPPLILTRILPVPSLQMGVPGCSLGGAFKFCFLSKALGWSQDPRAGRWPCVGRGIDPAPRLSPSSNSSWSVGLWAQHFRGRVPKVPIPGNDGSGSGFMASGAHFKNFFFKKKFF